MGSRLLPTVLAAFIVAVPAFISCPARANIWYVTAGGTGAQSGTDWDNALPTVTLGLQIAAPGDTVRVWAGLYPEHVALKPGVTVSGGFTPWGQIPFLSVLDGSHTGSVVTVPPGATPDTVLEGFTIQNGAGMDVGGKTYGGGIYCANASPVLRWNHVTACHASTGGGIYLANSSPEVSYSHFTDNVAGTGGAIACSGGSLVIGICTFRYNIADAGDGGAVFVTNAPNTLIGCSVFDLNQAASHGSAVMLDGGAFLSNTVIRNRGSVKGSIAVGSGSAVGMANTVVADNGSGIWVAPGAAPLLMSNDVWNNASGNYSGIADQTGTNGNISDDPALADPLAGDYTPCFGSPCVDRGNDGFVPPGAPDYYIRPRISGVCVDIGAAELVQQAPLEAIRVKGDTGNDANDGLSWAKAKKTFNAGVQAAIASGREVWVARGSYYESIFVQDHNVMLYGGFAGTETARNQRNPAANETSLDTWGTKFDALRVYNGKAVPNQQTVIDGFTITNSSGEWVGGHGIVCSDTEVVISGNKISKNKGTGISYGWSGSPIISCNDIAQNLGGGIHVEGAIGGRVLHNTIAMNGFNEGTGGVHVSLSGSLPPSGTFDICNNVIRGNDAIVGGGISVGGGTAEVFPVIRGNVIESNNATFRHPSEGGGIYTGGYYEIVGNLIMGNNADIGGGIANTSRISTETKDSLIANNMFVGNTQGTIAEVVHGGGGIGLLGGYVAILNNTFANNNDAVALMLHPHQNPVYVGGVTIRNNIFTGSTYALYSDPTIQATLAMSHNAFFANTKDYMDLPPGTADVFQDPRFVNPAAGNYHLRSDSPCLEVGLDTAVPAGSLDFDGEPRIRGFHVDIGADEYSTSVALPAPDLGAALRIAGGLQAATPADLAGMNVDDAGTSQGRIDLRDVVHLARRATGLE